MKRGAEMSREWWEGRRSVVAWLHARAKEMNDPSAQSAFNGAANELSLECKKARRELAALQRED